MSTEHDVILTYVELEPHPNADSLSIARVDGRPVVVRTSDFPEGRGPAVYLPVDTLVPVANPRFAFLEARGVDAAGYHRIRATRLRGVFSMGLLLPATEDDFDGRGYGQSIDLGTKVWEPPVDLIGGDSLPDPGFMPVYTDVESWRKWATVPGVIEPGRYYATEKIHGANARYCYVDDQLWCGSRTNVKRPDPRSPWWLAAEHEDIVGKLARLGGRFGHGRCVVFGEVYGQVQDLRYGVLSGVRFVAFDLWDRREGRYFDFDAGRDALYEAGFSCVPQIGAFQVRHAWLDHGPTDAEAHELRDWSNGKSILGAGYCVREGIVIRPEHERHHTMLGRVILKLVGEDYMTRKEG